jgi:hypothetical protein
MSDAALHCGRTDTQVEVAARPPRFLPLTPVIALVALSVAVVGYLVLRNGGWVGDDNYILVLARAHGFGWQWLSEPLFQHWGIGWKAIYSGMLHVFPLDFRWALLLMLAALAAGMLLFERVIGLVIGRGWLSLAVTVWFGLSIIWTRELQWWASGIQAFPTLLCDLLCLYAFLRFRIDQRGRWVAVSAGALAFGLLFFEKPAAMVIYLALVRGLLMPERFSARAAFAAIWQERRLWLSYCVVIAIWGGGYLASGAYGQASSGHVSLGGYLHYFRVMWLNTLAPALAGFTLPASNLSALQTIAAAFVQLAIVALVAYSVARKRRALGAWALIVAAVVLNGIPVAHTRFGALGVPIAQDLRYVADFVWLVPFALCYALSSDRVLRPRLPPRDVRLPLRGRVGAASVVVALVLVAYAAGSVASAVHLEARWSGHRARTWEQNV